MKLLFESDLGNEFQILYLFSGMWCKDETEPLGLTFAICKHMDFKCLLIVCDRFGPNENKRLMITIEHFHRNIRTCISFDAILYPATGLYSYMNVD